MRARVGALVVAVLVLGPVSTAHAAGPAKTAKTTTVATQLLEFKVKPNPKQAKTGNVLFKVKNTGAVEHELVVVSTPPGGSLATKPDGSVDETQLPAGTEKGRIDLLHNKSGSVRVSGLAPGSYTLFCNLETLRSDGTYLSHYKLGMHTTFRVG